MGLDPMESGFMVLPGRYRIHVLRGEEGRFVCLAGTNHVRHDLSFDQVAHM